VSRVEGGAGDAGDAWAPQTARAQDLSGDPLVHSPMIGARDLGRPSAASTPATKRPSHQIPQPDPLVPTIAPPEIFKVSAHSTDCHHELNHRKGTASRSASQ
jgi:hypothetical protein